MQDLVAVALARVLQTQETSQSDLALMPSIDALHLDYAFAGSRMLQELLRRNGFAVARKHGATRMKKMRIVARYKKPTPAVGILRTWCIRICCGTW